MTIYISGFLRNFDLFGYDINLNFNRRGKTHKTAVGGFFSLLVYMFIGFFVFTKVSTMINLQDGEEITRDIVTDFTQVGEDGILDLWKNDVMVFTSIYDNKVLQWGKYDSIKDFVEIYY